MAHAQGVWRNRYQTQQHFLSHPALCFPPQPCGEALCSVFKLSGRLIKNPYFQLHVIQSLELIWPVTLVSLPLMTKTVCTNKMLTCKIQIDTALSPWHVSKIA